MDCRWSCSSLLKACWLLTVLIGDQLIMTAPLEKRYFVPINVFVICLTPYQEAPVHSDPLREDSKVSVGLKLPKFSLLTFDGKMMNWCHFQDLFSVSIHDKKELSNTEKLAYLRDVLKGGPAEAVIRGLAKTGDTYCMMRPQIIYDSAMIGHVWFIRLTLMPS